MAHTLQTAVMGVSGYAGAELARLLLRHPYLHGAPPVFLGREHATPERLTAVHPQLADNNGTGALSIEPFSWTLLQERGVELLFLATPHEQSRSLVPGALGRGIKVVDLSGAWRLQQPANRVVYRFEDEDAPSAAQVQAASVYGLPELHREVISMARVVANPGCYATSIILALKPLIEAGMLDLQAGIICDAKSGVSGAGKEPTATTHFMHAGDNLSAYALFRHRHTGELLEQLGLAAAQIVFTPHLLPIPRGILSTIYVTMNGTYSVAAVESCFRRYYAGSPMIRVYAPPALPEIRHSVRTSFADIGFQLSPDGHRCILISCLDNLLKGAAGQAVQNMNAMYGWPEAEGLL